MKSLLIALFFGSLLILVSCSNSVEDPGVDCSLSDLDVEITDSAKPDCDVEGSITVIGSGGSSPYEYSLNGVDFQSSSTFSDVSAGNYSIVVRDADGCTSSSNFNLNAGPNGITVALNSTESNCLSDSGTIEVNATGGDGSYLYSLNSNAGQASNTFVSLAVGLYRVTVTDGTGCEATREVLVASNTSLSNDIMPIISSDCAISGCHNGSQSPNLTTPASVISNAQRIKSETQSRSMPRGRTLTQNEIDLIACWVDSGAKDN